MPRRPKKKKRKTEKIQENLTADPDDPADPDDLRPMTKKKKRKVEKNATGEPTDRRVDFRQERIYLFNSPEKSTVGSPVAFFPLRITSLVGTYDWRRRRI